jgi:acyl carrier protein
MNTIDILTNIFREEFESENLVIDVTTSSKDIENWDSLANINIIVASEREFNIKFSNQEIKSFQNVGDMIQLINNKLK